MAVLPDLTRPSHADYHRMALEKRAAEEKEKRMAKQALLRQIATWRLQMHWASTARKHGIKDTWGIMLID